MGPFNDTNDTMFYKKKFTGGTRTQKGAFNY